jgi:pilus assembly protein CpaB
MNSKKLALVAVIAGIAALLITFGLYKHNQSTHDAYVQNKHGYQYLAASKDIGDGSRIGPDDVMVVNWTSDQPVIGAFSVADKAKVVGRIVSYPVSNGMLMTEKYLAGPDSSLGLPHKIPMGMRAISIKTDDANDLGGFLFPGAKVDILAAVKSGANSIARSVVIVQNVAVLATGKQMTPDPEGKPSTVSIVTVLVTPDQAQKVALAQQESSLYVSLRNGGDEEILTNKPALFTDISGVPAPQVSEKKRSLASEQPFPPIGTTVETIMGEKVTTQLFRNNLPVSANNSPAPAGQPNTGVRP